MTSPNGNIFRVTGPLCEGNPQVTGGLLSQRPMNDAELLSALEQTFEQTIDTSMIWDAIVLIMTSWILIDVIKLINPNEAPHQLLIKVQHWDFDKTQGQYTSILKRNRYNLDKNAVVASRVALEFIYIYIRFSGIFLSCSIYWFKGSEYVHISWFHVMIPSQPDSSCSDQNWGVYFFTDRQINEINV